MNKKDIEARISKLEEELKEIKELLANYKEDTHWKPSENNTYFYVNEYQELSCDCWQNDEVDNFRYDTGNCFRTNEEAEHRLELLETERQLMKYAREHNEWDIDWDNEDQTKWHLTYYIPENKIVYSASDVCKACRRIYFTSKKIAEQAVAEIGEERVKAYLKEL